MKGFVFLRLFVRSVPLWLAQYWRETRRPGLNVTDSHALFVPLVASAHAVHQAAHYPHGVSFPSTVFLHPQIAPMAQIAKQGGTGHHLRRSACICGSCFYSSGA